MTDIHIRLTKERLNLVTWGDLISLEEAQENGKANRAVRDIAAKFVANGQGDYLPTEEAIAQLNQLPMGQMVEVTRQLLAAINDYSANPTNGSDSPSLPPE